MTPINLHPLIVAIATFVLDYARREVEILSSKVPFFQGTFKKYANERLDQFVNSLVQKSEAWIQEHLPKESLLSPAASAAHITELQQKARAAFPEAAKALDALNDPNYRPEDKV